VRLWVYHADWFLTYRIHNVHVRICSQSDYSDAWKCLAFDPKPAIRGSTPDSTRGCAPDTHHCPPPRIFGICPSENMENIPSWWANIVMASVTLVLTSKNYQKPSDLHDLTISIIDLLTTRSLIWRYNCHIGKYCNGVDGEVPNTASAVTGVTEIKEDTMITVFYCGC